MCEKQKYLFSYSMKRKHETHSLPSNTTHEIIFFSHSHNCLHRQTYMRSTYTLYQAQFEIFTHTISNSFEREKYCFSTYYIRFEFINVKNEIFQKFYILFSSSSFLKLINMCVYQKRITVLTKNHSIIVIDVCTPLTIYSIQCRKRGKIS